MPSASVSAGSFGRAEVAADAGVHDGGLAAFAAFESIDDDGWRDHASTRIRRLYARIDGRTERDELSLAATLADNYLEGTQALPVSMLGNPRQAYTWPDSTDNRLAFVSASGQHAFDAGTLLAANAYFAENSAPAASTATSTATTRRREQPFEAFNLATDASTQTWGASVQGTLLREWAATRHQLVAGAAFDAGTTDFDQCAQPAMFAGDREAVGIGAVFRRKRPSRRRAAMRGLCGGHGRRCTPQWSLVVSGRYNRARITTEDRSGAAPAVNGTSTYRPL